MLIINGSTVAVVEVPCDSGFLLLTLMICMYMVITNNVFRVSIFTCISYEWVRSLV